MPQLLASYKAKFDAALQRHKESQAAKVNAAKRKRMTFFASMPAFCPDEAGFLTAAEDNNDNDKEEDDDDDTSLTDPSKMSSSEGSTASASLYSDNDQAGSLHSEEMQFLS
eukprot:10861078-Ditylum_brightwellii.AAC.1